MTTDKRAKMRKPKTVKTDGLDLRRWCVEMAMRWPVEGYSNLAGVLAQQQIGDYRQDADIIGRAKKLYDWMTAQ